MDVDKTKCDATGIFYCLSPPSVLQHGYSGVRREQVEGGGGRRSLLNFLKLFLNLTNSIKNQFEKTNSYVLNNSNFLIPISLLSDGAKL